MVEDIQNKSKLTSLIKYVIFLIIILILIIVFYYQGRITGDVILGVETTYLPDENLDGTMRVLLRQGELIPADSIVLINVAGQENEYILSELIDNNFVDGDFFAEDTEISGTGEGYGVAGEAEIYPDVEFVLKIVEEGEVSGGGSGVGGGSEEETPTEETTEEEQPSGSSITGGTTEEPVEEETTTGETTEESSEPTETTTETTTEEGGEETKTEETTTEESSEPTEQSTSPLTGGVVMQVEDNIEGTVNADSEYTYNLESGQTVELVSSSQDVEIVVENGVVTVTTDYSEIVKGFGQEFLGDYDYEFEIDLSSLEIPVKEGELSVSLSYTEQEIVFVSSVLSVEEPDQSVVSKDLEEEIKAAINESVEEVVVEAIVNYELTEEELFVLKTETGTSEVEITKADVVDGRLIIRFEVGGYWLENSYDYSGDESSVKEQVELDRVKWVKRLAGVLLEEGAEIEEIEGFVGSYGVGEVGGEVVEEVEEAVAEEVVEVVSGEVETVEPVAEAVE